MRGSGLKVAGGILQIDAAAKLHVIGIGVQCLNDLLLVVGTEGDNMAAAQPVLSVKPGIVGRIMGADKVGVGTAVGQAATDNLFYLTLVKIDAGSKRGQGANSK